MRDRGNPIENLINFPRRMTEVLAGLEGELDYLRDHNFFEEFERLGKNTELMLEKITELNETLVQFTRSVQEISNNTQVLGRLEERMSVPGLAVATLRDFFVLLRRIIDVAILRNLRLLDDLRKGKPLSEVFPRLPGGRGVEAAAPREGDAPGKPGVRNDGKNE
ncbi:MAG: hypothetical protein AB1742_14800 [bacterium]